MKTVLIITSKVEKTAGWVDRENYVKSFAEAVTSQVDDLHLIYTTYQDMEFKVKGGQLSIFDTRHQQDLKDVDFAHFKNWTYEVEDASIIAFYLRQHGIPFANQEVEVSLNTGKISQMFRLAAAGLPVPDTLYARKPVLTALFGNGNLPEGFQYPLIMKSNDGSRGDNNFLVKSAAQAQKLIGEANPETEFVLQNFVSNDGDYRFLFIGKDEPLVFLRTAQNGSHLNNTSKGGAGMFVEASALPGEYTAIARQAAVVLGREISGVDIIVDKQTSKPYLLEVNSTPALATGYGLERKAAKFADYIKQEMKALNTPELTKPVIGKVEPITFVDGDVQYLPAKVDTGAYRSSIWATKVHEKEGVLSFCLLGPSSEHYSGKIISTSEYRKVTVENSFGHKEDRYSVFLKVRVAGKTIRSNFTLANRAAKTYPALIGRKMLNGRFVVDVTKGHLETEEYGDNSLE